MNNYRVCFGGSEIDYHANFKEVRKYYPLIRKIFVILDSFHIQHKWWFFEPYVEITWLDEGNHYIEIRSKIELLLSQNAIKDARWFAPKDGKFADWYCKTDGERHFGAETYARGAELAQCFYEYELTVADGMGWRSQYMRRMHVLANQLGFNYYDEGIMSLKRGILSLLFWYFGFERAVWIYRHILRQKY